MLMSVRRNGKALSPVITTIIIVAITIAIVIAVTYWMVGVSTAFTKLEKLDLVDIDSQPVTGGFNITVMVKNTGSVPTTVDGIFFNERFCDISELTPANPNTRNPFANGTVNVNITFYGDIINPSKRALNPGDRISFTMFCPVGGPFRSGVNLELALHSSGGKFYLRSVLL